MGWNADERLARRAASGDRAALEEIFRRHHQDLYRYCLATVGNPDDAQEAVQNAMLKVVRALPGEKREIKLKPWLYRIARNEAVETLRRRRDSVELSEEQPAATLEVADTAASRERLRALFADLEQLPERQRSGLVMRELAGLGFEEIGTAFETTAAVARQTVYEARLSLRQMEAGREMGCPDVKRELSDADGRITRRREIRAHLRDCPSCRAFEAAIAERRSGFAAIATLPAAASAALLGGALGGGSGAGVGAAAGGLGAGGAGKAIAGSVIAKSVAAAAVVATIGVGVADRSGVVDLPLPESRGEKAVPAVTPAGEPADVESSLSEIEAEAPPARGGRGPERATETEERSGTAPDQRNAAAGPTPGGPSQPGTTEQGQANGTAGGNSEPGPPTSLPEAAAGGQETAAGRKSPRGNQSPGTPRSAAAGKAVGAQPPTSRGQEKRATPAGGGKSTPSQEGAPASPAAPDHQPTPPGPGGKPGQTDEP
jgi:RNA polymerase sigma factor (sigma-70 family)